MLRFVFDDWSLAEVQGIYCMLYEDFVVLLLFISFLYCLLTQRVNPWLWMDHVNNSQKQFVCILAKKWQWMKLWFPPLQQRQQYPKYRVHVSCFPKSCQQISVVFFCHELPLGPHAQLHHMPSEKTSSVTLNFLKALFKRFCFFTCSCSEPWRAVVLKASLQCNRQHRSLLTLLQKYKLLKSIKIITRHNRNCRSKIAAVVACNRFW